MEDITRCASCGHSTTKTALGGQDMCFECELYVASVVDRIFLYSQNSVK